MIEQTDVIAIASAFEDEKRKIAEEYSSARKQLDTQFEEDMAAAKQRYTEAMMAAINEQTKMPSDQYFQQRLSADQENLINQLADALKDMEQKYQSIKQRIEG